MCILISDCSNGLLSSVRSGAGETRHLLLGGIWGNSTGTARLGSKTWQKTLFWSLEKSVVSETPPDSLCPLQAFPFLASLLQACHKALGCGPGHCPLLGLPQLPFSVSSPSQAQAQPPQTVVVWLSCVSLASQSQPSHHKLSPSTRAAPCHQSSLLGQLVSGSCRPSPVPICHQTPPFPRQMG